MCLSPALFDEVNHQSDNPRDSLEDETAFLTLLAGLEQERFHCAHSVLDELRDMPALTDEMRQAATVFIGGVALSGSTCGAMAAGAMAVSANVSGIERSIGRTLRMIVTMVFSTERALRDDRNAFNPALRAVTTLAEWFEREFGTTQCAKLTGVDFTSQSSVEAFCATGFSSCKERARRVAAKVHDIVQARNHVTI
jgi:hypothetical protein